MRDDVRILNGDCREQMAGLDSESIDSIITDPPYELGFMGKRWDSMGIAYDPVVWSEALRVLKPGGHLLAFGGTRTWHRVAVAVEDSGFEIRDSIAYMYGSGFPKSHNLRDEWQGWGTALKPAHEPIVVARKPLIGTVAENVLTHGTGALNIDGCRVGTEERTYKSSGTPGGNAVRLQGGDGRDVENARRYAEASKQLPDTTVQGRWPANVILDESQAAELDRQSGQAGGGFGRRGARENAGDEHQGFGFRATGETVGYGDMGGASRFFYCAKASKRERPTADGIAHPTVKPLTLMRYLVRLVTPPQGIVLDPFAGSGTTIEAALLEGFNVIGIEREADYLPLIQQRIERTSTQGTLL